jgi:hypothetical protein
MKRLILTTILVLFSSLTLWAQTGASDSKHGDAGIGRGQQASPQ